MDEVFKLFGTIALNMGDFDGQLDSAAGAAEGTASKISSAFQEIGVKAGAAAEEANTKLDTIGEGSISGIDRLEAKAGTLGADFNKGAAEAAGAFEKIGADAAAAGDKVSGSGEKAKSFGSGLMSTFGSMALITGLVALGEKVKELIPEMVSGNDAMVKWKTSMEAMGNSKGSVDKMAESVETFSKNTGVSEESVESLAQKLAGVGVPNFMNVTTSVLAMSQALGASPDKMTRATKALQTVQQTGKLTTSTFATLNQAIPGSAELIQKAMGEGGKSATQFAKDLKDGKVTTDDFYKALQTVGNSKDIQKLATQPPTMSGALQKMKTNIIDSGETFMKQLGSGSTATNALNSISTLISSLMKVAGDLVKALMPVASMLAKVVTAIGNFLDKNKAAIPTIEAFVTAVLAMKAFSAISGAITAVRAAIEGATLATNAGKLATLAYNIVQGAMAAAAKIAAVAQAAFNAVMDANLIMRVITAIAALVAGLIYFFTQTTAGKKIWEDFMNWLQSAWQTISGFFTNIWNSIVKTFSDASTAIGSVWKTIQDFFETAIDVIKDLVQVFIDFFTGNWGKLGGDIQNLTGDLWNNVKKLFSDAGSAIKSVVSDLWNGVVSFFSNGISKAYSFVSDVGSKIGGFFKAVPGAIISALGDLGSIGANLVNGIIKGVESMAGNLIKSVESMAKSAVDGIKNFLGIKSPSTVMDEEVGQMMGAGMARGIGAKAESVANATVNMAQNAVDAVKKIKPASLVNTISTAIQGGAAAAGVQSQSQTALSSSQMTQSLAQRIGVTINAQNEKIGGQLDTLISLFKGFNLSPQVSLDGKLVSKQLEPIMNFNLGRTSTYTSAGRTAAIV